MPLNKEAILELLKQHVSPEARRVPKGWEIIAQAAYEQGFVSGRAARFESADQYDEARRTVSGQPIYQVISRGVCQDVTKEQYDACEGKRYERRIVYAAPIPATELSDAQLEDIFWLSSCQLGEFKKRMHEYLAEMSEEWKDAFDERHEFDDYPEHFMTGLRNEFCAGWQAARLTVSADAEKDAALTDEERTQLDGIVRCDPSWLLMDIRENSAFDAKIVEKVFELAKQQARSILAAKEKKCS